MPTLTLPRPTWRPGQWARPNPNHPFSAGMVGCWVTDGGVTGSIRDRSRGNHPTLTTCVQSPTAWGMGCKTAVAASEQIDFGTCANWLDGAAPPVSIRWRGVIDVLPAVEGCILGRWSNTGGNEYCYLAVQSTGGMVMSVSDGSSAQYIVYTMSAGTLAVNTLYDIFQVWDSATTIKMYINGNQVSPLLVVPGNVPTFATGKTSTFRVGGVETGANPTYRLAARTLLVTAHRRLITPVEAMDAYLNPFGFFDQDDEESEYSFVTVAPGGFSSAFFRENAGLGVAGGGPFARANAGLGVLT